MSATKDRLELGSRSNGNNESLLQTVLTFLGIGVVTWGTTNAYKTYVMRNDTISGQEQQ